MVFNHERSLHSATCTRLSQGAHGSHKVLTALKTCTRLSQRAHDSSEFIALAREALFNTSFQFLICDNIQCSSNDVNPGCLHHSRAFFPVSYSLPFYQNRQSDTDYKPVLLWDKYIRCFTPVGARCGQYETPPLLPRKYPSTHFWLGSTWEPKQWRAERC